MDVPRKIRRRGDPWRSARKLAAAEFELFGAIWEVIVNALRLMPDNSRRKTTN